MIRVSQGLGNQMFQYALGEIIKLDMKEEVLYDTTFIADYISGRKMRDIADIFDWNFRIAKMSDIRRVSGKICFEIPVVYSLIKHNEKVFHLFNSILWKFRIKKAVEINEPEYWNLSDNFTEYIKSINFSHSDNYYLNGFWESVDYIADKREFLRKVFKFRVDEETIRIGKEISKVNSISVHVRRGDYVSKSGNEIDFMMCDEEYYKICIEDLMNRVDNPKIYVFSDDVDYAKRLLEKYTCVEFIIGKKDYEDMYLMSMCLNNIITNSTFSFWAAFLNKNDNAIVKCPQVHYRKKVIGGWKNVEFPRMTQWEPV